MAYKSLRDFIQQLEADGELVRVSEPVSTVLEMTEIGFSKAMRSIGASSSRRTKSSAAPCRPSAILAGK
jgi:hypothetical protein